MGVDGLGMGICFGVCGLGMWLVDVCSLGMWVVDVCGPKQGYVFMFVVLECS